MMEKNVLLINKKNVLRQKPRLLYAGLSSSVPSSLHHHAFTEIFFVKAGSGKIVVDDESYPFVKGDLVIYNKNVNHYELCGEGAGSEVIFAAFDNINLAGMNENSILKDKDFCIVPTENYYNLFLTVIETLIREKEEQLPFSDVITDSLIRIVLMLALRFSAADAQLTFTKNNAYIAAKELFDKNFTTITSIDDVCKSLYINKFYLTHIFTQQLGIPPVKYLISKRMDLAKRLLETTELDVADISKSCGYVDVPYFCRVFKKAMGSTPLQYRFRYKARTR